MPNKKSAVPDFQFHPAQAQIANDPHRFRVVNCGRRFGKTLLAVYEMIGIAGATDNKKLSPAVREHFKEAQIAYIAPTYQQARDIAWNQLKKIVKKFGAKVNESRLEVTFQNGSKIFLRGWESIETLRGQFFHFLVIDEIAMMKHFFMYWQEVLLPTLTDKKGKALFLSTPKGFNHFYDLYNEEHKDPEFKSFHFTSYDNPFLPREDLTKYKDQMTEDRFAQEYLADFRKTQGLVYKEFKRHLHLLPTTYKPNPHHTKILGVDFGWNNPSVILEILLTSDLEFHVISEWYKPRRTIEQIIERALQMEPQYVYPDQQEAAYIEKMRQSGLNVRETSKRVLPGIDKVTELFLQNRIKIHPNCKNTILELETYSYPDDRDIRSDKMKDHPLKENDHAMDALRYVVFNHKLLHQKTFQNRVHDINEIRHNKNNLYD